MRERLVIVAVAMAAAPAGLFLAAPSSHGDIVGITPQPPGFPWESTTVASAWGLLAALAVCVGARRVADALFVGGIAAVVLLVVSISSAPPTVLTTVAAGVLLGAALQLARAADSRSCAVAVVIGAVVGILVAPLLARVRADGFGGPRRYADFLPSGQVSGTSTVDLGAAVLGTLSMLVLIACLVTRWRTTVAAPARGPILGAAALVVGGALVHWWFLRFISDSLRDETRTGLHTFYGGYVLLGLAVVAAMVHVGRTSLVWVAAAASTTAIATDGTTSGGAAVASMTVVLVAVAANVTTTVLRRTATDHRARGVVIAVVLLAVFSATQFVTEEPWAVVPILLGPFGVPVVVTMAIAAAVVAGRPEPATVVGALALLVLTRLTTGTDFGWTSYTPLSDGAGFDGIASSPSSTPQTVAALIALGLCGVVAAVLARRPTASRQF
ncbi:hypothetical protein [Williamsia serinedens]|uniref:Uncharacterized protein n=1 Tax=Williamsia serinedens TaxID=391736 RepID=A0ABT1GZQ7_9NOCA|nr:hypothetical protein [Williamsia serinedens]MCP2159850.1 hypothetical protein [Williamsia serinedens]